MFDKDHDVEKKSAVLFGKELEGGSTREPVQPTFRRFCIGKMSLVSKFQAP
jgi:hypothetical protein